MITHDCWLVLAVDMQHGCVESSAIHPTRIITVSKRATAVFSAVWFVCPVAGVPCYSAVCS